MWIDDNATLYEDLTLYFKWHRLKFDHNFVKRAEARLKLASKHKRSILTELDQIVIDAKNGSRKRNYWRENVTRIMREKGMTEEQAERLLIEKQNRLTSNKPSSKRKKPFALIQNYVGEPGVVIGFENALSHFVQTKDAINFLCEKFGYTYNTARVTLGRNLNNEVIHKSGWYAFRIS